VEDGEKRAKLRNAAKFRRVALGVVGQGGISMERMKRFVDQGTTVTYHGCQDAKRRTHDDGQLGVILDLTTALGVGVDLHVWQPGRSFKQVADCFREAGKTADLVCLFQSFWGKNAALITAGIRESPGALFVSPYVQVGKRPTSNAPQGSACKPWDPASIPHFATAIPLARKGTPGTLLTPLDRGAQDSEAINFVAPSYYASGPGGTCPAGATTTACSAFLISVMKDKPTPAQVIAILRETATIDPALLGRCGFDKDAVARLKAKVSELLEPTGEKQRKLDAGGVLNLYAAFRRAVTSAP